MNLSKAIFLLTVSTLSVSMTKGESSSLRGGGGGLNKDNIEGYSESGTGRKLNFWDAIGDAFTGCPDGNEGDDCSAVCPCSGSNTCEAWNHVCRAPGEEGDPCHATRPCGGSNTCEAGSQVCRAPGEEGDPCHATRPCGGSNTCEAGSHVCRAPGKLEDPCHLTRPCGDGLSCQPGVHKCYHSPRQYEEPCSAGYGCDDGMSCHPGIHKCYHSPRMPGEPCSAGYECGTKGFSCAPLAQRCLPDEIELSSELTCGSLRDDKLADLAIDTGGTYSYGTGIEVSVGPLVITEEYGTVYGEGGEFSCYAAVCVGGQTEVVAGAVFVNMGVFDEWDSFPGQSFCWGGGVSVPLIEAGYAVNVVHAIPGPGQVGDAIGEVTSFSLGFGVSPVTIGGAYCYTEIITDVSSQTLDELEAMKDDARKHAEDSYNGESIDDDSFDDNQSIDNSNGGSGNNNNGIEYSLLGEKRKCDPIGNWPGDFKLLDWNAGTTEACAELVEEDSDCSNTFMVKRASSGGVVQGTECRCVVVDQSCSLESGNSWNTFRLM